MVAEEARHQCSEALEEKGKGKRISCADFKICIKKPVWAVCLYRFLASRHFCLAGDPFGQREQMRREQN